MEEQLACAERDDAVESRWPGEDVVDKGSGDGGRGGEGE